MKIINAILWTCIFLLVGLIILKLFQRQHLPPAIENVKEVLTEKTLPAFKSTTQDIFPEQREKNSDSEQLKNEKF